MKRSPRPSGPLTSAVVCLTIGCGAVCGVFAGGAAAGCGGGDTGGGGSGGTGGAGACPNDLPESCPAPEPGYSKDVAPIIEARCATCHSAGGQAGEKPLDTYAEVYSLRTNVLTRVYGCKMPPAGATQLTEAERATLLAWLVCGAKEN